MKIRLIIHICLLLALFGASQAFSMDWAFKQIKKDRRVQAALVAIGTAVTGLTLYKLIKNPQLPLQAPLAANPAQPIHLPSHINNVPLYSAIAGNQPAINELPQAAANPATALNFVTETNKSASLSAGLKRPSAAQRDRPLSALPSVSTANVDPVLPHISLGAGAGASAGPGNGQLRKPIYNTNNFEISQPTQRTIDKILLKLTTPEGFITVSDPFRHIKDDKGKCIKEMRFALRIKKLPVPLQKYILDYLGNSSHYHQRYFGCDVEAEKLTKSTHWRPRFRSKRRYIERNPVAIRSMEFVIQNKQPHILVHFAGGPEDEPKHALYTISLCPGNWALLTCITSNITGLEGRNDPALWTPYLPIEPPCAISPDQSLKAFIPKKQWEHFDNRQKVMGIIQQRIPCPLFLAVVKGLGLDANESRYNLPFEKLEEKKEK